MPYNRDNAIAYAKAFWTIPCKDGLVGTDSAHMRLDDRRTQLHAPANQGWVASFVRDKIHGVEAGVFQKPGADDKVFQAWNGLEDCAHFLSQCVRAGGAGIETQWGVRELVEGLQGLSETKTLAERVGKDAGQRIVDSGIFKLGDMIGYYNNNPKEGKRGYGHSAMYVGGGGITCHSVCRFKGLGDSADDEWDLSNPDYSYTLIHFSSGDVAPDPATAGKLAGWWTVQNAGRTRYYYILDDGRARWTPVAPRKATDQAPAGMNSAYWFQDHDKTTFIWKETGDCEVWTVNSAGNVTSSFLNGIAGKVTRLF